MYGWGGRGAHARGGGDIRRSASPSATSIDDDGGTFFSGLGLRSVNQLVEHNALDIVYTKSEFIGEGAGTVRVKLPSISYVIARSSPHNIIGRGNRLPSHLRTDLTR